MILFSPKYISNNLFSPSGLYGVADRPIRYLGHTYCIHNERDSAIIW